MDDGECDKSVALEATVRIVPFLIALLGCPKPLPVGPDTDTDGSDTDSDGPNTPEIDVAPLSLSIGPVGRDCQATGLVTVTNGGSYPLDVDVIEVQDDDRGVFDVVGGQVQVLAPGDAFDIEVGFTPDADGPSAATLRIHSDDRDEWEVLVALDGSVSDDPLKTEDFQQATVAPLDVLLVLDRDAEDWLDGLTGEIGTLAAAFTGLGLDFQLAVVNMDMSTAPGTLVGGVPVITQDTPSPGQQLVDNIEASDVDADQRAFDAVNEALETVNPDFVRDGATLSVVAYSPSDDRSQLSATDFATWMETLKADPDDVAYHGVVGASLLPCFSGLKIADPAPEHIDAVGQTGGEHLKICDYSSAEIVNQLATMVSGLQAVFPLSDPATDASGISVEVDGQPVVEDVVAGWTYDAVNQSIVFHGTAIPVPGAQIAVTYPYPTPC